MDAAPNHAAVDGWVTIQVRVVDDQGVGAVTAWLDRDFNAQFRRSETDEPLGEVYFPDFGTTDRFTLRVRTNPSWPENSQIAVDAVDVNGEWSSGVYYETISINRKPFVADLVVFPDGAEWVAQARVSQSGEGQGAVIGATFFVDLNGNAGFDHGTDIDLGASRTALPRGEWSYFEKRFAPQPGWSAAWIGATAFDARPDADKFGVPRIAKVRQIEGEDWALVRSMTVRRSSFETTLRPGSGVVVDLTVSAAQSTRAVTLFHDVNRNGMWDYAWDVPIGERTLPSSTAAQSVQFTFTLPGTFVPGRTVAIAAAVQDRSGRGDDAWGPVFSTWKNVVVEAWAQDPFPQGSIVQLGTSYELEVVVRDDRRVQDVRLQYRLRDDHSTSFVVDFPIYEVLNGAPNAARWRITVPTNDPRLTRGNWELGVQAYDFEIPPTRWLWTDLLLT